MPSVRPSSSPACGVLAPPLRNTDTSLDALYVVTPSAVLTPPLIDAFAPPPKLTP